MTRFLKNSWRHAAAFLFLGTVGLGVQSAEAQTLPTGVTTVPIYDTANPAISFRRINVPVTSFVEVPGKPRHFLVLGYYGMVFTLYPDTTKADTMLPYGTGGAMVATKHYKRTLVANFHQWVMKGYEFGALGIAVDPNFRTNRKFYVLYNKFGSPAQYDTNTIIPRTPGTNCNRRADTTVWIPAPNTGGCYGSVVSSRDGPGNSDAWVALDRYTMMPDYNTVQRDTEIIRMYHGAGYGSAYMVFGKDNMLYISADGYNQPSWDSTILTRKIIRIDVSATEAGRMYRIPTDNPWYNKPNPAVRKEIYAMGFRNTYSMAVNYLNGDIWGGETGQNRWEEINKILPGRNYGWNNGADASSFGGNSQGIEGPCILNGAVSNSSQASGYTATSPTSGQSASLMTPYVRPRWNAGQNVANGALNDSLNPMDCSKFTHGTWNFASATATDGLNSSYMGSFVNWTGDRSDVPAVSPVFRGNPSSPFYGYFFITDINHANWLAVKSDTSTPQSVGSFATNYVWSRANADHNGPVNFAEDSYGALYPILLSSSGTGPFQYHDIHRMEHPQMTLLATPRAQVHESGIQRPGFGGARATTSHPSLRFTAGSVFDLPQGYTQVSLYDLAGRKVWSYRGKAGDRVKVPATLGNNLLNARFQP